MTLPSQRLSPTPSAGDGAGWLAFAEETRALAGDRDPLATLAELPGALEQLVGDLSDTEYRTPEGEGRWSAADVVAHLMQCEMVWGGRIRQILAEDEPPMLPYDQDRWVERLDEAQAPRGELLALLTALRRRHLALYAGLGEAEWARRGVHGDRGAESLRDIVRLLAGHDLRHRRQLQRIRVALGVGSRDAATRWQPPEHEPGRWVIRHARPGDREGVLALLPRLEAFGLPENVPAGSIAAGEAREMSAAFDALGDLAASGRALLVAASPSDAILGVLFLETRVDYFSGTRHGHVGVLAIAGGAEGQGLGRALLETADDWASSLGYGRITLHVFEGNARARALYARAGYAADLLRYRRDLGAP